MSKALRHKGYIGFVEYSVEDKCLFGKIEMIDDLITFEAETIAEVEKSFIAAVDGYLETCEQLKRNPQKPYKGIFNVRIAPELHRSLHQEALENNLSLNSYIEKSLSAHLKSSIKS